MGAGAMAVSDISIARAMGRTRLSIGKNTQTASLYHSMRPASSPQDFQRWFEPSLADMQKSYQSL
jgi:hypothetical protein